MILEWRPWRVYRQHFSKLETAGDGILVGLRDTFGRCFCKRQLIRYSVRGTDIIYFQTVGTLPINLDNAGDILGPIKLNAKRPWLRWELPYNSSVTKSIVSSFSALPIPARPPSFLTGLGGFFYWCSGTCWIKMDHKIRPCSLGECYIQ